MEPEPGTDTCAGCHGSGLRIIAWYHRFGGRRVVGSCVAACGCGRGRELASRLPTLSTVAQILEDLARDPGHERAILDPSASDLAGRLSLPPINTYTHRSQPPSGTEPGGENW